MMNSVARAPAANESTRDLCTRLCAIRPPMKAATGYERRNPPVSPMSCDAPPNPWGLNTGRPEAPSIKYRTIVAAERLPPSVSASSITPKVCRVIGTGVNHSGIETCAQTAISRLPPTTADRSNNRLFVRSLVGWGARSAKVCTCYLRFRGCGSRLDIMVEAALFAFNLFQLAPEFGVGEMHPVSPDEQQDTSNASRQSGYRSQED